MDKLGRSTTPRRPHEGDDEVVQANSVFDISSLVLYGSQAAPIRLKILLDRLFSVLQAEDVNRIISGFGWSAEDYTRGYIIQTFTSTRTTRLAMVSYNEEMMIIQQFLRFGETKYLAQEFLAQEHLKERLLISDTPLGATPLGATPRLDNCTSTASPPSQNTPPAASALPFGFATPPYCQNTPRRAKDDAPLTKAALLSSGILSAIRRPLQSHPLSPDTAYRHRDHAPSPEHAHKHVNGGNVNNNNNKSNPFLNSDLGNFLERAQSFDISYNKGTKTSLSHAYEGVKREVSSPLLLRSTPAIDDTRASRRPPHGRALTPAAPKPFDFSRIGETVCLPRERSLVAPSRRSMSRHHTSRYFDCVSPPLKRERADHDDEEPLQALNFSIKDRILALTTPPPSATPPSACATPPSAIATPPIAPASVASVSPLLPGALLPMSSPLAAPLSATPKNSPPWVRHSHAPPGAVHARKTIAISKPISDLPAGAYAAVPRGMDEAGVAGGGGGGSPSGKKRVLCTSCRKTFCDKGALKIHYSAVHLKEMHACTVTACTMVFSSRRSRNRHSANPNPKLHMPQTRRRVNDTSHKSSCDSNRDPSNQNAFGVPDEDAILPPEDTIVAPEDDQGSPKPAKPTDGMQQGRINIPISSKYSNKRKAKQPTKYVPTAEGDTYDDSDDGAAGGGVGVGMVTVTPVVSKIYDCDNGDDELTNTSSSSSSSSSSSEDDSFDYMDTRNRVAANEPRMANDNAEYLATLRPVGERTHEPMCSVSREDLEGVFSKPEDSLCCTRCGVDFEDSPTLLKHMRVDHPRVSYHCTIEGCFTEYETKAERDRHSIKEKEHAHLTDYVPDSRGFSYDGDRHQRLLF